MQCPCNAAFIHQHLLTSTEEYMITSYRLLAMISCCCSTIITPVITKVQLKKVMELCCVSRGLPLCVQGHITVIGEARIFAAGVQSIFYLKS